MATFFGLVDSDIERRSRVMGSAREAIGSCEAFRLGGPEVGGVDLAWAVAPSVPVSTAVGNDGVTSLVVGDIDEASPVVGAAGHVLGRYGRDGSRGVAGLNGYYATCVCDAGEQRIVLAGDVLGLFPIYYWTGPGVCAFSSSPGLFRLHPLFRPRLNAHGLASVLLVGHITNGQCIWEGCRRLSPGSVLVVGADGRALEQPANAVTLTDAFGGISFERAADAIADRLEAAVTRCGSSRGASQVMLSGGLDSRLVAGLVADSPIDGRMAVTYGAAQDVEMRCAAYVAKHLGWDHSPIPVEYGQFEGFGVRQIDLEVLSTTFHNFAWWCGESERMAAGRRLITGFVGDAVMGGSHISWAYDEGSDTYTFDKLFGKINRYGFPVDVVRSALAKTFPGDPVGDVIGSLRDTFDGFGGLPYQRSWMFDLLHRQRLHVAPGAWRLSFGSWARMPYADREVIEAAAGMPLAYIAKRRLQIHMMQRRFPGLARLPLDRSDHQPLPLVPSVYGHLRTLGGRVLRKLRLRRNDIFYHRIYDVNNPGWRSIRMRAEAGRPRVANVLGAEFVNRWAPDPTKLIAERDPVVGTAKNKALYGLMLLAESSGSIG